LCLGKEPDGLRDNAFSHENLATPFQNPSAGFLGVEENLLAAIVPGLVSSNTSRYGYRQHRTKSITIGLYGHAN